MKRFFIAFAAALCLILCTTKAQVSVGGLTPSSTVIQVTTTLQPYLSALLSSTYGGTISFSGPSLETTPAGDKALLISFSSTSGMGGSVFMPYYNTNPALAGQPVGVTTCNGPCICRMMIGAGLPLSCGCSFQGQCTLNREAQNNGIVAPLTWWAFLE